MGTPLNQQALDQLFLSARSYGKFEATPVDDATLQRLYDLLKWGPTAFNAQPARYVFVRSAEAKARLEPALSAGNKEKTLAAPVTVIVAHDTRFHERLANPKIRELFEANTGLVEPTFFRNSSLQAAYLIVAARALGLDVGPMSGFDAGLLNQAFFPDGRYQVNLIANLGYGVSDSPAPRAARFSFDEVAEIR
ncbi:malonic semialdehyde reductase [Thauera linaloolentis]|uniref:Malonic semialdehyde reductase n=1 Tax=Thauera linaloolentis (strain DSM 12138 / JCM 21573 / CCUG 41526 / CIP 105981 / IAM 15112 / NBRC 102519 / 47Lol) TaxID=1123367 RepID=N6YP85_THAL4|nr:malonic semialdehyde reductase [Thauera linaloolentis]ENO83983.1 malonic semialdehyde reductase [Thauera linaloolentis 47Lol = DSM 12138]MCM8564238.1 malonic semialdehyde reductase [Thauera linaloolentis]